MTDRELMEAMYREICGVKTDVQGLKDEMQGMKEDIRVVRDLENETNHNIQLLAENHIELINKLNDAIHVQDKSLMFEVQISGLKCRMDTLELELRKLKSQTV
jgi:hypothetical protein